MKRAVFGKTILTTMKANVTAGVAALALSVAMPASAAADTLADASAVCAIARDFNGKDVL